jgi:FAD synthetase
LITIVARDANVLKFKGQAPLHHENKRVQDIKDLNIADLVELGHEHDYFFAIKKYKPEVIALGYDQTYLVKELSEFLYNNEYKTELITIEGFGPDEHKSSIIKRKMK